MEKEEELEFELELEEPQKETPEDGEQQTQEEFDEIYSDEGVEELLQNDEIAAFEEGFMHGYLEEGEEGT